MRSPTASSSATAARLRGTAGFSLVELLTTIMILGLLATLAMLMLGRQYEVYEEVQAKRNAQELVNEFVAAQVAGVDLTVPGDKLATLAKVAAGGTATEGSFKGRRYGLTNVTEKEWIAAAAYVEMRPEGWLTYSPEGVTP